MAGGVSINLISGFLLIPWGLQINLSYYWGHYITMTAIIPFFIVLHIGIPMEIADRGNDGYDLLKAAKVEGQLPNIHFFGEIELVRNLMKTVNQIVNERELLSRGEQTGASISTNRSKAEYMNPTGNQENQNRF